MAKVAKKPSTKVAATKKDALTSMRNKLKAAQQAIAELKKSSKEHIATAKTTAYEKGFADAAKLTAKKVAMKEKAIADAKAKVEKLFAKQVKVTKKKVTKKKTAVKTVSNPAKKTVAKKSRGRPAKKS